MKRDFGNRIYTKSLYIARYFGTAWFKWTIPDLVDSVYRLETIENNRILESLSWEGSTKSAQSARESLDYARENHSCQDLIYLHLFLLSGVLEDYS